jgi:DNA-directed RNA polymerase specialized sigma24 family protein
VIVIPDDADLPEAYAAALRLRDSGFGEDAIAERLGIRREAVGSTLRLAEAKLAESARAAEDLLSAREATEDGAVE